MLCSGLSEKEIEEISKLLEAENIKFTVGNDESMMQFNDASMQNNLRHLNSPNISTHILQIDIPEEEFAKISEKAKERLLNFGITDEVPSELDFEDNPDYAKPIEEIQNMKLKGDRAIIGLNFFHVLILISLAALVGYFYRG